MGDGEAKDFICTTHGYELRRENTGGWRRIKGRKKWDNCNSIINKIYFKKFKCMLFVLTDTKPLFIKHTIIIVVT